MIRYFQTWELCNNHDIYFIPIYVYCTYHTEYLAWYHFISHSMFKWKVGKTQYYIHGLRKKKTINGNYSAFPCMGFKNGLSTISHLQNH